jgi:RimJ/RimL family protein N-acetyltransferase
MSAPDFEPLRTERLVLRRFRDTDLAAFLEYRNDPAVARYQGWSWPTSEADALAFIAEQRSAWLGEPGGVQVAVALAESDELLGDLYFGPAPGDGRQATIGYSLARRHQGRGYATEAVRGLLEFAFGELGLHRVTATVDPRNLASVALLERLGMRREGHFVQAYYDVAHGEWTDEYLYALLREEWLRRGRGAADGAA